MSNENDYGTYLGKQIIDKRLIKASQLDDYRKDGWIMTHFSDGSDEVEVIKLEN